MKRTSILALAAGLAALLSPGSREGAPLAGAPPAAHWTRGLPADPSYFPIAVWLQNPARARDYQAAGVNLYVGLWQGPTAEQLSQLKAAGMPVIVGQSERALKFADDRTIVGWMHGDEPDNAQEVVDPATGKKGYGPCIPPSRIVEDYKRMRSADPTRPVLLNLGQGVANDAWVGRGSGARLDDYLTYVQGCDIVSFDVYPVADNLKPGGGENLGYLAKGLDRLAEWTHGARPAWNCIECTQIGGDRKATPEQVRAEVWLSLVHGSRGIIYFVHQFKPTFNEHALLDDPPMLRAVTSVNRSIRILAPVLNSPTVPGAAVVTSPKDAPAIDWTVKRQGDREYVIAVNAHATAGRASFVIKNAPRSARAEVVDENRGITVSRGRFDDSFEPYGVHIYRLSMPQ